MNIWPLTILILIILAWKWIAVILARDTEHFTDAALAAFTNYLTLHMIIAFLLGWWFGR